MTTFTFNLKIEADYTSEGIVVLSKEQQAKDAANYVQKALENYPATRIFHIKVVEGPWAVQVDKE